jgi:hypothetical protein
LPHIEIVGVVNDGDVDVATGDSAPSTSKCSESSSKSFAVGEMQKAARTLSVNEHFGLPIPSSDLLDNDRASEGLELILEFDDA